MFFDHINPFDLICKEIANQQNNLIFKHLEPYGITRENFNEQKHRIKISDSMEFQAKIVFVDNKKAFSILISNPRFIDDESSCKFEIDTVVVPF